MTQKQIIEVKMAIYRLAETKGIAKGQIASDIGMAAPTYYGKLKNGTWTPKDINILSKYFGVNFWRIIADA